ncbi:phage prohead protease [Brucella melitensis bv. 3 str. Ether]|nr:phage prohead protease [Brucella melitensis bv. 3 str. Ether]
MPVRSRSAAHPACACCGSMMRLNRSVSGRRYARMRAGFIVEGRLAKGVARAREALELMRSGGLDGLSIGFRTVRARKDARTGLRHITQADLWEISVVTFPMLPQARVTGIKAGLPTIREFERWLTRDAGLSRAAARTVIAKGYAALGASLNGREAIGQDEADLAGRMRRAARTMI